MEARVNTCVLGMLILAFFSQLIKLIRDSHLFELIRDSHLFRFTSMRDCPSFVLDRTFTEHRLAPRPAQATSRRVVLMDGHRSDARGGWP